MARSFFDLCKRAVVLHFEAAPAQPGHSSAWLRLFCPRRRPGDPPPLCALRHLIFRRSSRTSCPKNATSATSFPMQVVHARTTRPLNGLIWPKAGCASIVWPQRRRKTFFPWACRPFLASQESFAPPSSAALRPCGCVADRIRLADRHRGRGGLGLENSKEMRHG